MATKNGEQKREHTEAERNKVAADICAMYSEGAYTLASCCEACGITDRMFRFWIAKYEHISEQYKKAKARQSEIKWDLIREKAVKGLERLVEGEEYTEKRTESGVGSSGMFTKDVVSEVVVLPNPTAVIFALKGEFPERFADRQKTTTEITVTNPEAITPETIAKIEALLGAKD